MSITVSVANAKTLTLVAGIHKPPYVFQKSHEGFELELVRSVVEQMGHKARFIYVPNGRLLRMIRDPHIDGLLTVNRRVFPHGDLLSEVYITYRNVLITRKSDHIGAKSLDDLKGLSLAAFQNAKNLLSKDFKAATDTASRYMEVPDQVRQVKMLVENRVDGVIMDENIFYYNLEKLQQDNPEDYESHYIFPSSGYSMAFKTKEFTAAFNQAFREFASSDAYFQLLDKYYVEQDFSHLHIPSKVH